MYSTNVSKSDYLKINVDKRHLEFIYLIKINRFSIFFRSCIRYYINNGPNLIEINQMSPNYKKKKNQNIRLRYSITTVCLLNVVTTINFEIT